MREFVPEHSGPRIAQRIRGAFLVNATALRAADRAVSDFIGQIDGVAPARRFSVHTPSGEPTHHDRVETVIDLRNPKANAIVAVSITAGSPGKVARIVFDAEGRDQRSGVVVDAVGPSADDLSSLAAHFVAEAANLSVWFSSGRRAIDSTLLWLARTPSWARWSLMLVIGAVFLLSVIDTLSVAVRNATPDERVESAAESRQGSAVVPLVQWIVTMCGALVLGWIAPRALGYLFPRVEFAVGDGVQRHERLRSTRNFVLLTVFLSGIVLPFARSWLLL